MARGKSLTDDVRVLERYEEALRAAQAAREEAEPVLDRWLRDHRFVTLAAPPQHYGSFQKGNTETLIEGLARLKTALSREPR